MQGAWKSPLSPNNKQKAKQTEKSITLLNFVWEVRSLPSKLGRPTGESHNLSEQKNLQLKLLGNQRWSRKSWTRVDELVEAQCGQFGELKTPGGIPVTGHSLHFSKFDLWELDNVFMMNIKEKSPPVSGRGRAWQPFEVCQTALF